MHKLRLQLVRQCVLCGVHVFGTRGQHLQCRGSLSAGLWGSFSRPSAAGSVGSGVQVQGGRCAGFVSILEEGCGCLGCNVYGGAGTCWCLVMVSAITGWQCTCGVVAASQVHTALLLSSCYL
jgi:hypothetical protein